ncbi:unnamed protein product [Discula destructiva]
MGSAFYQYDALHRPEWPLWHCAGTGSAASGEVLGVEGIGWKGNMRSEDGRGDSAASDSELIETGDAARIGNLGRNLDGIGGVEGVSSNSGRGDGVSDPMEREGDASRDWLVGRNREGTLVVIVMTEVGLASPIIAFGEC